MTHGPRAFVTGLGICMPMGDDVEEFSRAMFSGQSAIGPVTAFDASSLTSQIASTFSHDSTFRVPESLQRVCDKATLSAYTAMREALRDSGLDHKRLEPHRIAVVCGSSHAGIESTEKIFKRMCAGDFEGFDPREASSVLTSAVGSVIGAFLGATGPRLTISSACASSNTAIGIALDLVSSDRADCVVVVGTDSVSLAIMAGFNALRALSPSPTAPFSTPHGLNLGEGAAVFVIERSDLAQLRGKSALMEVLGYGLSSDAYHVTAPDSTGDGARRAMMEALRDANLLPSDIDYVSAHGTGTLANDPAEAIATESVFGQGVPLSSVKSFVGHTLGASGIVEAAITYLYAKRGLLPPTRNFAGLREGCPSLNYVPNTPVQGTVTKFLCNSFGFGGNNSSVVLSVGETGHGLRRREVERVVITSVETVNPRQLTASELLEARKLANEQPPGGKVPHFRLTEKELAPFARSAAMIRYGLLAAFRALSGHAAFFRDNPRCGVVAGMLNGASSSIERYLSSLFEDGPDLASAQQFPMTTVNACAGQVAIANGIKGFNTTICGGQGAFYYARDLVLTGRQDAVLAISAEDHTPGQLELLKQIGFETSWAEGAAGVVIEQMDSCRRREVTPLCEVLSAVIGQEPRVHLPSRGGLHLAEVARSALAEAKLQAADIDAIISSVEAVSQMKSNVDAAVRLLFPDGTLLEAIDDVLGYSPACAHLWNIVLGALLLGDGNGGPKNLLVLDTDLTGANSAVVLTKYPG